MTDVILEQTCKSLQSCRHILPGVEPGPMPGAHLPGAKPLARQFAMSGFTGDSAPSKTPGKRPVAKAFSIFTKASAPGKVQHFL